MAEAVGSYNPALITPLDRVRHLIGDTQAPWLRDDTTILSLLATNSETGTVAILAEGLASEFALQPSNVSIPGGPGLTWGDRVKRLSDLAGRMRAVEIAASNAVTTARLGSFAPVRGEPVDVVPEYQRPLLYFPGDPV